MDQPTQIAAFLAGGSVVSFIWHCGMYAGKLRNMVDRQDDRIGAHDIIIADVKDDIRDLKLGR